MPVLLCSKRQRGLLVKMKTRLKKNVNIFFLSYLACDVIRRTKEKAAFILVSLTEIHNQ